MGDAAVRVLRAEPLSAALWAPFGWLPVDDTDPADGRQRLHFDWQDPHLNVIAHDLSEIECHGDALYCDGLYRHVTHTQALLVLDAPAVVAVAPPSAAFNERADAAQIRAFLLRPLDALVLHAGTWHWGPFPVGVPRVRLYNLQGLGYREDNERVDLAAVAAGVDISVA